MKDYVKTAKEVINGEWGNGETRRKLLEDAGYDYNTVQTLVNRILNGEDVGELVDYGDEGSDANENEKGIYELTISRSKYKGIKLIFTD